MTWFRLQVAGHTIYIQAIHAEQAFLRLWHGWETRDVRSIIPEDAETIVERYDGTPVGEFVFARPKDTTVQPKSESYRTKHPKIMRIADFS